MTLECCCTPVKLYAHEFIAVLQKVAERKAAAPLFIRVQYYFDMPIKPNNNRAINPLPFVIVPFCFSAAAIAGGIGGGDRMAKIKGGRAYERFNQQAYEYRD